MKIAVFWRMICALVLLGSVATLLDAPLGVGTASAQGAGVAEKDAFEAAKELGTVEAWDAFLSNYSTGFHADLARAYVKKLAEAPRAAETPAAQAKAESFAQPQPAGSWGGIVRDGPGQDFNKVASLNEGEPVNLLERTDVVFGGYPWFKISFRNGETGYKWGGILCSTGREREDIFQTCPAARADQSVGRAPKLNKAKSEEPKRCGKGRVMVDGRCIRKRDAATSCGPGFRLKGNTCVQGYAEPKPQKQLPSWQIEAIKKGCAKGMGWNAQEGCHPND